MNNLIEFRLLNERAIKNIVMKKPPVIAKKAKYDTYIRPEKDDEFKEVYIEIVPEAPKTDRYRPSPDIVDEIFNVTH
jgi:hypothetical protein